MENKDLTYWKNYQAAMQWIQGNTVEYTPEVPVTVEEENEESEFPIDDDLLDFYRHTREHRANRSNDFRLNLQVFTFDFSRKSKSSRNE
jgi:hypothetical protein